MKSLPLSEAKDHLSALLDEVHDGETITITRHGQVAGVLVNADALDAMLDTLEWLNDPTLDEDIKQGEAEIAAHQTLSLENFITDYRARHHG
jgi:prevent-host-death family protein